MTAGSLLTTRPLSLHAARRLETSLKVACGGKALTGFRTRKVNLRVPITNADNQLATVNSVELLALFLPSLTVTFNSKIPG